MLKGENIIVFSHTDWRVEPVSSQHISNFLAEENKVLFVETFGSRAPSAGSMHPERIKQRFINWLKGIRKQDTGHGRLYVYSPITPLINSRFFLFLNKSIFLNILKRLIKKLEMKNPILYFYIPPPIGAIDELQNKAVIYHCVDEWATFAGGKNNFFIDAERRLIERADLVFTTNKLVYLNKKPCARRIHNVHHGVDYEHFTQEFGDGAPLPKDMRDIRRPTIAVIGAFADWVDVDLIRFIAEKRRDWSIVSIGAVEPGVDIKGLLGAGNVYFLGRKNYSELPNYYRAVDVFIVPFILNEHIKYCAPIRLYEHLSSGKPVITTDFPAAREIEAGLITIAFDKEDFIKKIETALKENDRSLAEKRKLSARQNTWKSKVEEISGMIEEIIR